MIEIDFFGKNAKFHHIGIAVRSITAVSPSSEVIRDPLQQVSVAFVVVNGIRLELIEPLGERSPVTQAVRKGVKLLHLCYSVDDIEAATTACRAYGLHTIKRPVPAVAFDNRKIAWVYSTHYGLFELVERASECSPEMIDSAGGG